MPQEIYKFQSCQADVKLSPLFLLIFYGDVNLISWSGVIFNFDYFDGQIWNDYPGPRLKFELDDEFVVYGLCGVLVLIDF